MRTCLVLLASCLVLLVSGCTDAESSLMKSVGSTFKVTLYNGGHEVKSWKSTGKVESERGSDGWYFRDSVSGKLIRVSGAVVVEEQ